MAESRTSSRKIEAALKEARAIELRLQGFNYREIADALGYASAGSAHKAVVRGLARLYPREKAEDLLRLELARLDHILWVLWPKVERGDLVAIDRALRVIALQSRLLGLDRNKYEVQLALGKKPIRLVDLFPPEAVRGGKDGNESQN